MKKRYTNWADAHAAAVDYARATHHDVALRKAWEFGKLGYNISLAMALDGDYTRAEIVREGDAR